jgi:hypothetical protein
MQIKDKTLWLVTLDADVSALQIGLDAIFF